MTGERIRILFYLKNARGGGAERSMLQVLEALDTRRYEALLVLGELRGEYLGAIPAQLVMPEAMLRAPSKPWQQAALRLAGYMEGIGMRGWGWRLRQQAGSERRAWRDGLLAKLQLDPKDRYARRKVEALVDAPGTTRLVRAIRSFKPHLLVSSLIESGHAVAYAALAHPHLPGHVHPRWVTIEQNNTQARFAEYYADAQERDFWEHITRVCYRTSARTIAVSKGVAEGLVEHYGMAAQRMAVVSNPVEADRVAMARPLEDTEPFILGVGRLHAQKRFDHLIRAFAAIAHQVPHQLVLLGRGPLQADLEALARELGVGDRVRFEGFSNEPWRYMRSASCFALSSAYEGHPLVLIEAMAAGCPVVSYACPYGPDEVVTDGVSGLLVPTGDVAALGKALLRVLTDGGLAARLASEGRTAAAPFVLEEVVRGYQAVFEELLTDTAGGAVRRRSSQSVVQ